MKKEIVLSFLIGLMMAASPVLSYGQQQGSRQKSKLRDVDRTLQLAA